MIIIFIDESIPLPDNLPRPLLEDIEELHSFYDSGDWIMFDMKLEGIESSFKNYVLNGKISRDNAFKIFHRYGNMI